MQAGRRRASGGVLLCLALLVAACAGPTGSGVASGGASSASEPPEAIGSVAVGQPSSAPEVALDEALSAFADGYAFVAEVTVGDTIATRAAGRRVGDDSEFTVEASGSKVTYRTIGTSAWVQRQGAGWVAVDGSKTDADPLAALRAPTSVQDGQPIDGAVAIAATYPPKALGLPGDSDLPVAIVIHADGTVEATYSLETAAGPATSTTTFSPLTDTSPIAAPG